jgi:hypothetical protein
LVTSAFPVHENKDEDDVPGKVHSFHSLSGRDVGFQKQFLDVFSKSMLKTPS